MSGANPEEERKPDQDGANINLKVKGQVKFLSLALSDSAERSEDIRMSGPNPEEERKPDQGGQRINLTVKGQDRSEVSFSIKRSSRLKKLMKAYCDRQSVDLKSISFVFDASKLRGEQTPDELGMEDGDEINAYEKSC